MSFGAAVAPAPSQLVGSCTSGTAVSLAPNDHCVPQAGNDGISSLRWSSTANHLISSNWDGGMRCWEVQEQGGQIRAMPKAQGELLFCYKIFITLDNECTSHQPTTGACLTRLFVLNNCSCY